MANPPDLARTGPHAGEGNDAPGWERDGGLRFEGGSDMFILSATAGFQTETAT